MRPIFYVLSFLFTSALSAAPFKVGLLLDKAGKDDKSFNASAFAGTEQAKKDLGVTVRVIDAKDETAAKSILADFVRNKFDLIIAVGFSQQAVVADAAPKYKNAHFVLIDSEVKEPNVKSILFAEHEGSFLVGAIAAMQSSSNKFGFIGGMEVPLIKRFRMGYEAGVKHIKPKATVIANYVGVTAEAWRNPAGAKAIALKQYSEGVDVIFHAAGASGAGLFDAAEQKKKFAIGVDSNQNWMRPKYILTSMLKRVDLAVYDAIKEAKNGQFKAGLVTRNISDQGVDFSLDENNREHLSQDTLKRIDAIKKEIISGKIKVPDFYTIK